MTIKFLVPRTELFRQEVSGVTRSLIFQAAYDFVEEAPRGPGRHGAELIFVVAKGPCAVTWQIMSSWFLPKTRKVLEAAPMGLRYLDYGLGEIDYHSPVPTYEGQSFRDDCQYTGGRCYSGGTAVGSGELFDKVLADPAVLWTDLEQRLEELVKIGVKA
jgi:hypothetical protein